VSSVTSPTSRPGRRRRSMNSRALRTLAWSGIRAISRTRSGSRTTSSTTSSRTFAPLGTHRSPDRPWRTSSSTLMSLRFFRRTEPQPGHRHVTGTRVWPTFVTVAELTKWPEVRSWGVPARRRLDTWIYRRPLIPYDPEVERTLGGLAGRAQRPGRPRPHHDTWVVACCIRHGVALMTLNTKHHADFRRARAPRAAGAAQLSPALSPLPTTRPVVRSLGGQDRGRPARGVPPPSGPPRGGSGRSA
jgi:predicted nucleic acid-binding protein